MQATHLQLLDHASLLPAGCAATLRLENGIEQVRLCISQGCGKQGQATESKLSTSQGEWTQAH
jgi:hypothetical protein